jgi:hypothetical protein
MTRTASFVSAITLALAACGSEPITEPTSPQFSKAQPDRPITGECKMQIQPPTVVSPGVIRQIDSGECQVSHLGRTTLVSDKVINLAAGTQTTNITLTAANGDELRASGTGTSGMVAPGVVRFTANTTVTGGTGRFADASGSWTINGHAYLTEARSEMGLQGVISY